MTAQVDFLPVTNADAVAPTPPEAGQVLWLCLCFPSLALRLHRWRGPVQAVFDDQHRAYAVSAAARAAGIRPGMSVAAASVRCGALERRDRDVRQEAAALAGLGRQCLRLTPLVSLAPPDAILLEVRGSLKLFGGFSGIQRAWRDELKPWSQDCHWAAAPTPLASLLLARQQRAVKVESQDRLHSALRELPIAGLGVDPGLIERLHKIGLRHLRDLWRLPRDGLARRFGFGLLNYLDRVQGRQADPRPIYRSPQQFSAEWELSLATTDCRAIVTAAKELFRQLVGFLRQQDAGVTRVRIDLFHDRVPATPLDIGTRHSTRDGAHLVHLLDQTLRHREVPAPVTRIRLCRVRVQPFAPHRPDLFGGCGTDGGGWRRVLDELEARLGWQAVRQVRCSMDHRPERAWTHQRLSAHGIGPRPRPLWLLARPQRLILRQGRIWRRGYLSLRSGPERIESGWWDGGDCRRDYYVADNPLGQRLWIFRDLKRHGHAWYLHGLFG